MHWPLVRKQEVGRSIDPYACNLGHMPWISCHLLTWTSHSHLGSSSYPISLLARISFFFTSFRFSIQLTYFYRIYIWLLSSNVFCLWRIAGKQKREKRKISFVEIISGTIYVMFWMSKSFLINHSLYPCFDLNCLIIR